MRLPAYQELSKEQDRIRELPLGKSHLVVGPPGTGKSVMALYRSRDFMEAGKPVKLLVHSRLLSQYTQSAVKQLGIEAAVQPFHAWFTRFYQKHFSRTPPQVQPWVYDWSRILTDINRKPPTRGLIPNLIIDEGQDLPNEFYIVAQHLATNITVFADENQRLTEHNSTIKDIRAYGGFEGEPHVLKRNYRNTREIAVLAELFEQGLETGIADPPTRSGPLPIGSALPRLSEQIDAIVRFERAYSDLEIGVFTFTKAIQKKVINRLAGKTVNPVQHYVGGLGTDAPLLNFDAPGIKVVNYPSTKGLEFDAVFIPELQFTPTALPDDLMKVYVLLSRAREWLFLSWTGDTVPPALAKVPSERLEWR